MIEKLSRRMMGQYASAALRIGFSLLFLVILVREFPNRHVLWGPTSPWTPGLNASTGRYSLLSFSDSALYFEVCYLSAIAISVLFVLGKHTRIVSVLFAIAVVSVNMRNPLVVIGGDVVTQLGAIYLVFTGCGRVWSLDARRPRATTRSPGVEALLNAAHNCAMFLMAAQMCLVYFLAGIFKLEGSTWRDGTALYYGLKLETYRAWPEVSDFVAGISPLVMIMTFLAVLARVLFPFVLWNRWLKYTFLIVLVGIHLGIATLMVLPTFSAAMIIGDLVFLPDSLLRRIPEKVRGLFAPARQVAGV